MGFTGTRNGKLIVFEGIDGTGKSTHINRLKEKLEGRGVKVVTGYEPTHGQWGKKLRESAVTGRLPLEEEVSLFLKDREEHVKEVIAPALARGEWVLLDRYYLSMMAYQGARGQDVDAIRRANEEFAPVPDIVIWLDIPVDVAFERIGSRGERDAFETETMLTACRNTFASIRDSWMHQVDGNADVDTVAQRVWDEICPII